MNTIENQLAMILSDIKSLDTNIKENNRLVKKIVRGEVREPDKIIPSKEFLILANKSPRAIYHILDTHPHLRKKIPGLGLCINYTEYLKLFR